MRQSYTSVVMIIIIIVFGIIVIFSSSDSEQFNEPYSSDQESSFQQDNLSLSDESLSDSLQEGIPGSDTESSLGAESQAGEDTESGSVGSSAQESCSFKQVSYALKNFASNSTCTEFQGATCVKKLVACSVEVQNLNKNISGAFGIKATFFELENSTLIHHTQITNYTLEPMEQTKAGATKVFQDVLAQKNITCAQRTENVPKKIVCT